MTQPVTLLRVPTDKEITAAFAVRVHHRRTELGLSLRAVAEISNVSHTMAWAVEGGSRHVSLCNAAKLAVALQIPLADLIEPVPCMVCLGRPQRGMTCDTCQRSTPLA